jgi:hypothetical protein
MKNYKEYLEYCDRLAKDVDDSYSDDIDINKRIHSAYQHIESEVVA